MLTAHSVPLQIVKVPTEMRREPCFSVSIVRCYSWLAAEDNHVTRLFEIYC